VHAWWWVAVGGGRWAWWVTYSFVGLLIAEEIHLVGQQHHWQGVAVPQSNCGVATSPQSHETCNNTAIAHDMTRDTARAARHARRTLGVDVALPLLYNVQRFLERSTEVEHHEAAHRIPVVHARQVAVSFLTCGRSVGC
jgi:hypothetical protein